MMLALPCICTIDIARCPPPPPPSLIRHTSEALQLGLLDMLLHLSTQKLVTFLHQMPKVEFSVHVGHQPFVGILNNRSSGRVSCKLPAHAPWNVSLVAGWKYWQHKALHHIIILAQACLCRSVTKTIVYIFWYTVVIFYVGFFKSINPQMLASFTKHS